MIARSQDQGWNYRPFNLIDVGIVLPSLKKKAKEVKKGYKFSRTKGFEGKIVFIIVYYYLSIFCFNFTGVKTLKAKSV